MILSTAVRVARLQPPSTLFPVPSPSYVPRSTGVAAFCFRTQMEGHPIEKAADQKPPAAEEEVTGDMMGESFGEGYATRSDEEGFGGIYYGKFGPTKRTHTDFDKSQGSEVKEKENGRHQTSAHGRGP